MVLCPFRLKCRGIIQYPQDRPPADDTCCSLADWPASPAFCLEEGKEGTVEAQGGFLLGYLLLEVDLLTTSRIERGVLDVSLLCQQRASTLQPIDALGPVELDVHSRDDSVACC